VFETIKSVVRERKDIEVIFPVHLNPKVQFIAKKYFLGMERIHLINPLDVIDFHNIAARSYLILTDSGGVQEEAPSFDVPTLVLREETERPEGVKVGALKLIGTDKKRIKEEILLLLDNQKIYDGMALTSNPYGDGLAAKRILDIIAKEFI
ncbi:UDP-N-acetylglucosamine 2-epimerase, partial [Enterococcus faecalis]|nr:UDP-N-acetylglucosamine 2-epimerase [Enterococcus faecalis]